MSDQENIPPEQTQETFGGFPLPTKNYFPMPNCWTDISAKINSLAELKVVEYILRHTWGYREFGIKKTISVDEFMHGRRRQDGSRMDNGTGLSEPSVKDGLKRGIADGYLTCEIDSSDQGRIKKSYGIKMFSNDELEGKYLTPDKDLTPVSILPSGTKDLTPWDKDSYPRSEKDTKEKHLKKNSDVVPLSLQEVKKKKEASAHKKREVKAPLTPEERLMQESAIVQAIVKEWLDIFKDPKPITETMINHARTLAKYEPKPGEIAQCRLWMYQTDTKKWYSTHGMDLGHIVREFEKFCSLAEVPQVQPKPAPAQQKKTPASSGGVLAKMKEPLSFSIID